MRKRLILLTLLLCLILAGIAIPALIQNNNATAATNIYASPIQGGCYIAAPGDCRLHVDPFTIYLATGSKLVQFQLIAFPASGSSYVIYDFRPDLSNPVPSSGSTYSPSLVAQDFAATCGQSYSIFLTGQDSLDPNPYSLGGTGQFTCPSGLP